MQRSSYILVLAAASIVPALAQRPDFSGTWKQGGTTGVVRTCRIEHRDTYLKVATEWHDIPTPGSTLSRPLAGRSGATEYHIDGVERTSGNANGRQGWSTAGWQGETLVILSVVKDGYHVTVTREAWTLSRDGNTLTRSTRVIDMDGVRETGATFARQ